MHLVQPLFAGPVDVVGDVHGEIEALRLLLSVLGYDEEGYHAEGRRLVFVGDLVDRGPDSPAVLQLVARLVRTGRAQCVMGNHELNLLRDDEKPDNAWWTAPHKASRTPAAVVDDADRDDLTAFLKSLPLALERDDLRVVHACWDSQRIDELRRLGDQHDGVIALFDHYNAKVRQTIRERGLEQRGAEELAAHGASLLDLEHKPPMMAARAEADSLRQMGNPIRVITSGEELPAKAVFQAGGKWRMVDRIKWWDHYDEDVPVIMGHYWRRFSDEAGQFGDKYGPDLFAGIEPHHWMGQRGNVYCVDFSVGARSYQKALGKPSRMFSLAAVRVPQWEVVHDAGARQLIEDGGKCARS